jgi:hypothetical protein
LLLIVCSFTCWGSCKQLSTSQTKDCDHASKSLGFPMLFVSTTWTISSITYFKKNKWKQSAYKEHIHLIYGAWTAFTTHIQCKIHLQNTDHIYCIYIPIYTAYTSYIQCIYTAYTTHIQCIYTAYTTHIQCIYIYRLHLHPHIHCIYMSYTEHIHLIHGAYT